MPSDIVELVREAYRAFNERRFEEMVAILSADVEWHQHSGFPEARVFRGRTDFVDNFLRQQFLETFPDLTSHPEELIESVDHVAVIGTVRGHGPSGIEFEVRFVHVWRFRGEKAVWVYDCGGTPRSF